MNNNFSKDASEILRQKGIDPQNLKNIDKNSLLKNLSAEDTKKINSILNDKQALNDLLNSEKAKAIMSKLFGSK
ncbi:MAG: hypothetical protein IJD71_07045 [Clostridia bacterium]|nr:hypothetical protein [Clostridia bacterium]MBQ7108016.1 hypothetical protein [Clostridia bacterium]